MRSLLNSNCISINSKAMRPKNNSSSDLWFILFLCILNSSLLKFPVWQYCDKPNDTSSADTHLAKYVGFDQVGLSK